MPAQDLVHILMIDDSPSHVRLMREAFKDAGVANVVFSAVADGDKGLAFLYREGAYAESPRPDLILLDLNMPRMNGHEVLAVLKADATLRSIPVLILSTSRSEMDVRKAYELHANGFICKPASLDELMEIVRAIDTFWLHTVALPAPSAAELIAR